MKSFNNKSWKYNKYRERKPLASISRVVFNFVKILLTVRDDDGDTMYSVTFPSSTMFIFSTSDPAVNVTETFVNI